VDSWGISEDEIASTSSVAGELTEPVSEVGFGTRFAIASLATWRVTHLLAHEDGPGSVVVRLRVRAGTGPLGELMDCFYCLSVWIACPFAFAIARRRREIVFTSLALSGAACLLERIVPGTFAEDVDLTVGEPGA
jgi:Protein of unknown function (DUF1360)